MGKRDARPTLTSGTLVLLWQARRSPYFDKRDARTTLASGTLVLLFLDALHCQGDVAFGLGGFGCGYGA